MSTENMAVWRATPVTKWLETPSRRVALFVYIGLLIMGAFLGALSPSEYIFFLSMIAVQVGAMFLITYLLLDMVADIIRSQKLIMDRLESMGTTQR